MKSITLVGRSVVSVLEGLSGFAENLHPSTLESTREKNPQSLTTAE
jgi:hypothetical protein